MSMSDRDGFIWYDGKLVPWRDATTHVLTHTLHYGMGVFEGVRAYKATDGTAIFRLQEHTDRLFNSAHIFQMKMPWDKATVMEAQREVVRARCNRVHEGDPAWNGLPRRRASVPSGPWRSASVYDLRRNWQKYKK